MRGVFDNSGAMGKEFHLLRTLGIEVRKVLAMLLADVRNDAYRRSDDRLQAIHLSGKRDACLEDSQRLLISQTWLMAERCELPDGQRDTNLRVVGFGRTDDAVVVLQQFVEPLLDHGLAVGAGDAYHGYIEERTDVGCEALESGKTIVHADDDGVRALRAFRALADDEHPHALLIELGDILCTVVLRRTQSEEQRFGRLGRLQRA